MLERKPWKRPRKGKKIPREKTDRDQSEPLLLSSFQLQWTPATQNLPGSLWPQGRLPGGGPAAGGAGGPKGPPNSTPLLRRHPTRDEPGTRALHLHGLTDTSWLVKIPMGPTLRAHAAHATIGTHTGSSLQPIGYASSEPLYLCDEIHLKSSEGHRTWGRDFAYAEAARGPFPNARSACTCGGPAQRCCLLNATETEDPLLIHSMKLPFLVHNVLIETSSSSSPGHAAKNDMPGQTRCTAPSSTSCSVA
jgi:hypothetical protein